MAINEDWHSRPPRTSSGYSDARDVRSEYMWSSRGSRGYRSRPWRRGNSRGRWRPDRFRNHWRPDYYRDSRPRRDYSDPREPRSPRGSHDYDRSWERPRHESPPASAEAHDSPADASRSPQPRADPLKHDSPASPKHEPESPTHEPQPAPEPQQPATQSSDTESEDLLVHLPAHEALKLDLPPTKLEAQLMDLYATLPRERASLRYLSRRSPGRQFDPPEVSSRVLELVSQHTSEVNRRIEHAKQEYLDQREYWLKFCSVLDAEHSAESLAEAAAASTAAAATAAALKAQHSPRQPSRGSRRTRNHGDAARSEAEFMEILANLELETARDPLVRAQLTSVKVPNQLFDPLERKALFTDTNGLVRDKSTLLARIQDDAFDTFTPEEHEAFSEAFVLYPKQFGKIAKHMGSLRSFHECVQHYYRTKKQFDYKTLVHKRKVRGKRGRKKKVADVEPPKEEPRAATADVPVPASAPDMTRTPDARTDSKPEVSVDTAPCMPPAASDVPTPAPEAHPIELLPDRRAIGVGSREPVQPTPEPVIPEPSTPIAATVSEVEQKVVAPPPPIPVRGHVQKVSNSIPPPVQPLDAAPIAVPPSGNSGIDALAALASEQQRLDSSDKTKGRKPRRGRKPADNGGVKVTSYWNAAETKRFETLLGVFGSRWEEIAKHIPSKSPLMLKNYFVKYKTTRKYGEMCKKVDDRIEETGVMPVYVSATSATTEAAPKEEEAPTHGPSAGFFAPRKRDLPVQSYIPDKQEKSQEIAPPNRDAQPDTAQEPRPAPSQDLSQQPELKSLTASHNPVAVTNPVPRPIEVVAPSMPSPPVLHSFSTPQRSLPTMEPKSELSNVFTSLDRLVRPPLVKPRTSLLASILQNDEAALPPLIPKSSQYAETDNWASQSYLPFFGNNSAYRESNERNHNN